MIRTQRTRVHDLVRFAADRYDTRLPEWVSRDGDTIWAVVRRQHPAESGFTALGLRGAGRSARAAIDVRSEHLLDIVPPEDLVARRLNDTVSPGIATALSVLARTPSLRLAGLSWGPTGSVGFELATGTTAVRATSDLDMILRADRHLPPRDAATVLQFLSTLPCRVDCLIETPHGAVALPEWAATAGGGVVLLRTPAGAILTGDPWRDPWRDEGR